MNSDSNNILKNEITLVTGASRGIGAGIAKLFGESGSYIMVFPRARELYWMFLTQKM